jgi:hemoglobin/transferrin/lactoferrin receptor protein
MKYVLFVLFSTMFYCFKSQTITVVDKITREPLVGVTIISSTHKNFTTNYKGRVSIENLIDNDSLILLLSTYKPLKITINELAINKYVAELEEINISLSEIIVSASKIKEDKIETPNRIQKLNMKEVAFQNPQTAADLIGTGGYAFIQKSQLGGGSPMIRGMATNRVLLVVDGVRMNNAIFRAGNLQQIISLDANALEGAELLFGPGAVMYGSDAIGGVMNFTTLEPKLTDSLTKILVNGNALMRTSTANSENTRHLNFSIGFKKWAFVTSYTKSDYGDLRSGSVGGDNYFYRTNYVQTIDNRDYMVSNKDSTLQIGSKYNQQNFMQKVKFKPNNFIEFDYGFHYSETSPYNRYDRLYVMQTQGPYKNKLRWAEWYYGPQIWKMNKFGINITTSNLFFDKLKITNALQNFEESRFDREFMVRELRSQKETVRSLSSNIDFDKKINDKFNLIYGLEFVHNKIGSTASLNSVINQSFDSTVTRYPNGSTWFMHGYYASIKYKISKKLIVSTGTRFSAYQIKATFDTIIFPFPIKSTVMKNKTLNGSIGFVFTPISSFQTYLNFATGFRAPNIDDMGKVFESTPGYLVVPNPNLKPERSYNAEIGIVKSFSDILKIDVTGYYTKIVDAMERKDFIFNGQSTIRYQGNKSNIQAVQNVANAFVYGIQSGIDINWKGFGLKIAYSWQHGKEQTTDSLIFYPLRHAAPAFGSSHLTYQHKKIKLDFYCVYNDKMNFEDLALTERVNTSYAKNYSKDPKGQNYSAGWYTLNFKTAFYLNQYVIVMAGVENIADILYRPYASGINAPGRNFIVSLKAKF